MAEIYRQCLLKLATNDELKLFDFPRPDPNGAEGKVCPQIDHHGFKEGACKRCGEIFDTTYQIVSECYYHPERLIRKDDGSLKYGCCLQKKGSRGCKYAPSHVHKGNVYDVNGYRTTQPLTTPPADGNYGVYAIDTESVHTKNGLEVCKVTVIDINCKVVYDEYCLPTSVIIDYNTYWSGMNEDDMQHTTKTFEEMRNELLALFNRETILVGHGLNNDLMVLKIVHCKIIDTQILYPHPLGLPRRQSLKDISSSELQMDIQVRDGHDSREDAEVTMKLLLKKLNSN